MKDIDFLPSRYRENTARRRGGTWRLVTALAFLAIIGGVDFTQRMVRRSVENQHVSLQQPFLEAQQVRTQLATLQAGLAVAEEHARLHAFLEHRWPATQLVAIASTSLPDSVWLSQIKLEQRTEGDGPPRRRAAAGDFQDPAAAADTRSQEARALDELRRRCGRQRLVLSGHTRDTAALQSFVAGLTRSPLAEKAALQSITKSDRLRGDEAKQEASHFVIHVPVVDSLSVIARQYGQPAADVLTARASD